jgi:RAB6A-GEF complex partner protein 2
VIAIKDFFKHLNQYKSENSSDSDKNYTSQELEIIKDNPFLIVDKNKEENLEFILEVLQDLTAKKAPHTFNITNAQGKIVKLTLYKLDFKIGEDIVGYLDFSDSEVDCVEFVVTLHSDERLSDDCKKNAKISNNLESHSYHKEFCLFIKNTFFTLHIPVTVAPTFSSDIGELIDFES